MFLIYKALIFNSITCYYDRAYGWKESTTTRRNFLSTRIQFFCEKDQIIYQLKRNLLCTLFSCYCYLMTRSFLSFFLTRLSQFDLEFFSPPTSVKSNRGS